MTTRSIFRVARTIIVVGVSVLALLATGGVASSSAPGSPEARLETARGDLIALRGSLTTSAARLWLGKSVASLGWAIGASCWAGDGASLDSVSGGTCLGAIRTAVNRLYSGDTVELRAASATQLRTIVAIAGDIARDAADKFAADPGSLTVDGKSLLWKVRYDISTGDAMADRVGALNSYIRAWQRLNGLANAVAPVTLGDQTMQLKLDYNPDGQAEAFDFVASGSSASTLNLYVDPASTASSLIAGIYADGEGGPGQLLGQASTPLGGGGEYNAVHLPQVTLTPGNKYWAAILTPVGDGILRFRDRCCRGGGTSTANMSLETDLTTLPATWSTGRVFPDGPLSIFGTS